MLACQFTQTLSPLQKVQYQLALEVKAEPPMPCHGLLSYKPARLVQSGAVYLSNCRGSLHNITPEKYGSLRRRLAVQPPATDWCQWLWATDEVRGLLRG